MDLEVKPMTGLDKIVKKANIKYDKNLFLKKFVALIINRIKENMEDPFNLDEISSSLCVSERTLNRRLKENNKTFLDIKDEIRKEYAAYLLSSGGYTVKQISMLLHFKNSSSFVQCFKRWHRCTPKQWMRLNS